MISTVWAYDHTRLKKQKSWSRKVETNSFRVERCTKSAVPYRKREDKYICARTRMNNIYFFVKDCKYTKKCKFTWFVLESLH